MENISRKGKPASFAFYRNDKTISDVHNQRITIGMINETNSSKCCAIKYQIIENKTEQTI